MSSMRKEKASYFSSNKVRSILLLISNDEIKNIKKNCYTKINSVSIREKVQMCEDIQIKLADSFTSQGRLVQPKQTRSSTYCNLPIKLQDIHERCNNKKGEFSQSGFQLNKLKSNTLNSQKETQYNKFHNNIVYKKRPKCLYISVEKSELWYPSIDKVEKIINYLNLEKAFFNNSYTYERAEKSFYYLQDLCDLYKIKEKSRGSKGFQEIKNMMQWKEELDKSLFNEKRHFKGKLYEKKGSMNQLVVRQIELQKCIQGNTNSDFILLKNLKGNLKRNANSQIKKNSVPCVKIDKRRKKNSSDLIKLLKCKNEDKSLSDTFQSDKSEISLSSSILSEISFDSESSQKKLKGKVTKKKVRRSNPTAKIAENPFKIQLINCEDSVKIRDLKYLNS